MSESSFIGADDNSYIASVMTVLLPYAPEGWLPCNGQPLQTSSFPALFSLIGNRYGGSQGSGTFNLPAFNEGGRPDKEGRYVLICVNGRYPVRMD